MTAAVILYATGRSKGALNDDYATVKYSSAGILLWSARYEGSGTDEAVSLTVDNQGSVIVTGWSESVSTGKDYTTVKYNNAGNLQWFKKYNRVSSSTDVPVGIKSDNNGNIFVTGYCTGSNTASYDYITLCYNEGGDQQWVKVFNGGLLGVDDKASSIDIDQTGSIYVTGVIITSGTDFDYGTVKYSGSGELLWTAIYESSISGNDVAIAVKTDNSGNVYVSGSATGSITGYDFLTVKYSQPIGINIISSEVPAGFSLGQNYPNPFNPVTNIRIQIPKEGYVKLAVYDVTGKEMAILVDEELNAGVYNVDFYAGSLSSGVYFYKIEAGEFTETRKMMLIK